jgi:RNA 3'-terminal phosphate cyclase (ATP)
MLTIDGSQGEGGGQILRTALTLSLWTQTPFRIENIRAGRNKPGLLRQHLTAVRAAQEISSARVTGDELGALALEFVPGPVRSGEYLFRIGSAGSCTLVLQTILLPLLRGTTASTVTLEGGTHNPLAPPFDFLDRSWAPQLRKMGVQLGLTLERPGFYPAGGGRVRAQIEPLAEWKPLTLLERVGVQKIVPRALISELPADIALRELAVLKQRLGLEDSMPPPEVIRAGCGPGNVVMVEIQCESVTEIVTGFGEHGIRAEAVAARVATEAKRYLLSSAPVGEYLADQLLLPLALAGEGSFRSLPLSSHSLTAIDVIRQFLAVELKVVPEAPTHVLVEAARKTSSGFPAARP